MRVTVYAAGGDSGDYVLSYGLLNNNIQDNGNWLKVADIGQAWGGGGGGSSTTKKSQSINFTGGESVFTVTNGTLDQIDLVEINGVVQVPTTDFTVSGQDVTLTTPIPGSTVGTLTVHYFEGLSVSPGYPNGLAAVDATGTAISFAIPQIYGSPASPETTNITLVTTDLVRGMVQILYHDNGTEPTYPAEFVKLGGEYSTTVLNIIYMHAISATRIEYTISQQV